MCKLSFYSDLDSLQILEIINFNILNSTSIYDYKSRNLEEQKIIFENILSKNYPIIVAKIDDVLVGFGMYSEFRFKEGYKYTIEHSIYVHPDFQGKGIGKLLLSMLIELAKKQNFHTMIGVIDSENISSILFHEQFGFKIVGEIKESGFKFNRWLNSIFMQLILE